MGTTIVDLHGGGAAGLCDCVFKSRTVQMRRAMNLDSLSQQTEALNKLFPVLDTTHVLPLGEALLKHIPEAHLPEIDGLAVVPKVSAVSALVTELGDWLPYNRALARVVAYLDRVHPTVYRPSYKLHSSHVRLAADTVVAYKVMEQLPGDYMVFPVQLGRAYSGRSVSQVRTQYAKNEFGLCLFAAGCILLTYSERLTKSNQLGIDCPGSEFATHKGGEFSAALCLLVGSDGHVCLDAYQVRTARQDYGSATGFLVG